MRIIDLFVDSLPLKDYGFKADYHETGRPAYRPEDLLKLFIYGYLNKVRSTRDLEKEARRNIEVMWLLGSLTPDHNTIFRFKDQNKNAIKKVFRPTMRIAKNFDLIGGKLIAGDSTKMRVQNSKKKNYNQAKIDRQLAYIDNRLQEYHQQLEQAEKEQDQSNRETLRQAIELQQQRKKGYTQLEKQLAEPIVVFFRAGNVKILKPLLLQRTRTAGVFDRSSLENCFKFETKWQAQKGF